MPLHPSAAVRSRQARHHGRGVQLPWQHDRIQEWPHLQVQHEIVES